MIVCKNCENQNPNGNAFCQQCGDPLRGSDTIGGLNTPDPDQPGPVESHNTELAPGDIFAGRYTVIEKIGQGGMGTVYKTSETLAGNERMIALKLIRADRLANQRAIDKLVNEGALTQDIRHRNVVNVYNVGVHEGQPFVAMELVKGVSLREWHRRQIATGTDVPYFTAAAIIRELLDGLEAAHDLDVIHRDLKPENIMLTAEPDGTDVKLQILDFGIARAPGTVETGTGIGTPHYMAPEQITNPDSAGPPADFYSVFKIWYELLMDVLPQGHWQPPSTGRPDVQPLVDQLIERGLSAKPSRRPQDTAQFRNWMATALPGFPEFAVDQEPQYFSGPVAKSQFPVDPKAIGIGCVALLGSFFLLIIGYSIINPDPTSQTGGDGEVIEEEFWDGEGGEVDPEEPVSPQIGYSDLSGQWNVENGRPFNMRVDGNGNFGGQGQSAQGVPVQMEGNIAGGNYVVGNENFGLNGQISWDGGCHLNFTTFNPNGSVNLAGVFHVDHAPRPGVDCPDRFNP